MSCRHALKRFCQDICDTEEASSLFRNVESERDFGISVRRHRRETQRAVRDFLSVQSQAVVGPDIGRQIKEIQIIPYGQHAFRRIVGCTERTVDILEFQQTCVGRSVGIDESVQAEIVVVLKFAVVSAIPVHGFAVFGDSLVDSVIAPFPDISAAQTRIFLCQIPVFLKVSGAVAHGMTVFDQKERLLGIFGKIVDDIRERRIHSSVEIDI